MGTGSRRNFGAGARAMRRAAAWMARRPRQEAGRRRDGWDGSLGEAGRVGGGECWIAIRDSWNSWGGGEEVKSGAKFGLVGARGVCELVEPRRSADWVIMLNEQLSKFTILPARLGGLMW